MAEPVAIVSCKLSASDSIFNVSGNLIIAPDNPLTAASIWLSSSPVAIRFDKASIEESVSPVIATKPCIFSFIKSKSLLLLTVLASSLSKSVLYSLISPIKLVTDPETFLIAEPKDLIPPIIASLIKLAFTTSPNDKTFCSEFLASSPNSFNPLEESFDESPDCDITS